MDSHDYRISFSVPKSPAVAFDAITRVREWWSQDIKGSTATLGADFTYRDGDVHRSTLRTVDLAPNRRIVWLVLENTFNFTEAQNEWDGTRISFEVVAGGAETLVEFAHLGLDPAFECFEMCSNAWKFFIEGSLKSLIMTGKGTPNPKENIFDEDRVGGSERKVGI